MAKKAKTAKAKKPKDRKKAARNAWVVRRERYGENGISPEVMKEREKAKKAAEKAQKLKKSLVEKAAKAKKRPVAKRAKR